MTRCFVIGPIGDKLAPFGSDGRQRWEEALDVFDQVIQPACVANGLEPVRADGIAKSGEITEQIFRHLKEDEVVIADLSGGNANVMYELGLRHTRDLVTITIGEYGQLPFDVNTIRTIEFSRSDRGLVDARRRLERAIEVGLIEGSDPVTATRVWLGGSRTPPTDGSSAESLSDAGENEQPDELNEAGFLDRMQSLEETFPRMTERVNSIGELLVRLGAEAEEVGRETQVLNAAHAPASARLSALNRFSAAIQPYADELTSTTKLFASDMSSIDSNVSGLLDFIEENPEMLEASAEFLDTLVSLAQSSRQGMEGLNQFAGEVRDLGRISRVLHRPGKQMGVAIDLMAHATAVMDDWEGRVKRLRASQTDRA